MKKYLTVVSLLFTACSPSNRKTPSAPDAGVDAAQFDGTVDSTQDNCVDGAKDVYVIDQNKTFSKFDPINKTFTDLGQLTCPAADGASPWSMGVDRNAIAWVLYDDGTLFRVDTATLTCTGTLWQPTSDLFIFGMGFSTDTSGGMTDHLFVAGGATHAGAMGGTFANIDTTTFAPTTIGMTTGFPELTGTAAAELWGFVPGDANGFMVPHVDKLDKTTGMPLQTFQLSSLQGAPDAYAFAFWGGHFYIFLDRDNLMSSSIFEVDAATGQVTSTTLNTGRVIVGAGVSTCAPLVITRS